MKNINETILDNQIIWLQCMMLHSLVGTRVLLHKMERAENNLCHFCDIMPEKLILVSLQTVSSPLNYVSNINIVSIRKLVQHLTLTEKHFYSDFKVALPSPSL